MGWPTDYTSTAIISVTASNFSGLFDCNWGYPDVPIYHGPSNPVPMPHISRLFKPPIIKALQFIRRIIDRRSEPRWRNGRWKAKV